MSDPQTSTIISSTDASGNATAAPEIPVKSYPFNTVYVTNASGATVSIYAGESGSEVLCRTLKTSGAVVIPQVASIKVTWTGNSGTVTARLLQSEATPAYGVDPFYDFPTKIGDSDDTASPAAGTASKSVQSVLRGLWVSAAAAVTGLGASNDAASAAPGTASKTVHSVLRGIWDALIALVGASDDAASAAPGTASKSLHSALRGAWAAVVSLVTSVGASDDAASAAPGTGSKSVQSAIRGAWEAIIAAVGASDDAASAAPGTASKSLQSALRGAWEAVVALATAVGVPEAALVSLVGMIGTGSDAAGTAGTAGESLHSKSRAILANLATVTSALEVASGVYFTDVLKRSQKFQQAAAGGGAGTLVLTEVTGGALARADDTAYLGWKVFIASGAQAGKCYDVTAYTALTKTITHTPNDIIQPDATVYLVPGDAVGRPGDMAGTGTAVSLFGHVLAVYDRVGLPAGGPGGSISADVAAVRARVPRKTSIDAYALAPLTVIGSGSADEKRSIGTSVAQTEVVIWDQLISLPEGANAAIDSILADLKLEVEVTGGGGKTGSVTWYLTRYNDTQAVGMAKSLDCVAISDTVACAAGPADVARKGTVLSAAIPATNGVRLVLCGLATDAGDTLTARLYCTTSKLSINYTVA